MQGSPSSDGGIYEQATGIVTTLTTTGTTSAAVVNSDLGCGSPSVAQVAVQDGGGSAAWGGYENGRIPASALCPVPSAPGLLLECGAAAAFDQLNTAFRAVFGQDIGITDAYRYVPGAWEFLDLSERWTGKSTRSAPRTASPRSPRTAA